MGPFLFVFWYVLHSFFSLAPQACAVAAPSFSFCVSSLRPDSFLEPFSASKLRPALEGQVHVCCIKSSLMLQMMLQVVDVAAAVVVAIYGKSRIRTWKSFTNVTDVTICSLFPKIYANDMTKNMND